ncbi:MAG: sugar nucleotide-binding protein [Pseudomonadales bacterium]|nr:sugar nucleotide-binding protein [Pseudomonadales bacterium]
MKLLVVGADSAVGRELTAQLTQRGIEYFAPEGKELDIKDPVRLARTVTLNAPDQLINLASFRAGSQLAVTQAEHETEQCDRINHQQAAVLAQVCDHLNIPLLHLSSAYVFAGDKKLGYNEQDTPKPAGIYGKTERLGEEQIIATLDKHIILRCGWVFGPGQNELLRHWIEEARANDGKVKVLRRKFSPTPAEDIARVIMAIIQQVDCQADVWGIYHYCGLETKRESEFVQHVIKLAAQHDENLYRLLDHLEMSLQRVELPEIVNATLATKKIFDTFGIKQRSWHGSLQALIKNICNEKQQ